MRRFLFCFALLSISNACHSPLKQQVSYASLASSTAGRSTVSADPRYRSFASEQEAFTWAKGFEASGAAKAGKTPRSIVPSSDPRHARAKTIVADIWNGYKKVYPAILLGLDAPYTILLEDTDINAYAVYDPATKQMPLAFFIQTAALGGSSGSQISQANLYGLIGHELAHLVMAHAYPGVNVTREIYYQVLQGQEELGFLQEDQANIRQAVSAWNDPASTAGEFPLEQLNGFPTFTSGLVDILRIGFSKRRASPDAPSACAAALTDSAKLSAFYHATLNEMDFTWPLDANGFSQLNQLTSTLAPEMTSCMEGGPTFVQVLHELVPDQAAFDKILKEDNDVAAQKDTTNFFTAITAITKAKYAVMRDLKSKNDYSLMRVRTFEEEADDNAMLVTHLIGQNSKGLGEFLFSMTLPTQDNKDTCTKILNAGQVPGYGLLSEPHHASCYRVFHVNLYHQLIFGIQ